MPNLKVVVQYDDVKLNSIAKIQTAILNVDNIISATSNPSALISGDSGLVSATQAQPFTAAQKLQARSNIDVYSKAEIGDINTNFVTTINTTYNS